MTPILEVRGLSLQRGTREILRGVDLDVGPRELVAVMGLSGAGKTTVLRAIAGLEPGAGGRVEIGGRTAAQVGFVFQFHCLFEHLSVLDNVSLAPVHVQRVPRREARAQGRRLLEELGIEHRAGARPRELSGGEAQRAAIARALAVHPPILLLDEPTASLDPPRRASLGALLRQLASGDRAILLSSHDVEFVREHATRVLVLAGGRVVEAGSPGQVFGAPAHEATRTLLRTAHPAGAVTPSPRP